MSASRAIFISYARDDLTVAQRLADALRAAELEVWLDLDELTGGDAWDRKIRGQIRDCALFVPVVSAQTQARREGYFRLEWKLADERTHLMAEGTPFIVPVVADETKERDALVPASFLAAQWTRLPHGEVPPAFCGRVRALLADEAMEPGHPRPGDRDQRGEGAASPPRQPEVGRELRARPLILAATAVLALAGIGGWLLLRPSPSGSEPMARKDTPPTAEKSAAVPVAPPASVLSDKAVAVLPFENLSPDKDNEFFASGMREEILSALQTVSELRVLQYRGTPKPLRQIGEELKAAFALECSVRRAGTTVRVTAKLTRAQTEEQAWVRTFTKEINDVFQIQSELAAAIAGELRVAIAPSEKSSLERRPTDNLIAYDLYLQTRELRRTASTRGFRWEQAEALLQAALALDPKFAEAWAMLCYVHTRIYGGNADRSDARLGKARTALETARRLAPNSSEVMRAQAEYHVAQREFSLAAEQFEKLVELQPNNADIHHQLGEVAERQGRWGVMLAERRRAVELDPGSEASRRALLVSLNWSRRYDEELATQRRFAALRPDSLADAFTLALIPFRSSGSTKEAEQFLGMLTPAQADSPQGRAMRKGWAVLTGNVEEFDRLWQRNKSAAADFGIIGVAGEWRRNYPIIMRKAAGDVEGARQMLEQERAGLFARSATEPDNDTIWAALGRVEALLGHREEALSYALRAVGLVSESVDAYQGTIRRRDLAFVYAWTGDKERAIAECARLLRQPAGFNVHELRRGLEFTPLRGDPRFEALVNDPKNNAPLF